MPIECSISTNDPSPGAPTALLGRSTELAQVRAFISGPAEEGDALVLSGEAGIGKTALLEAAYDAARTAGHTVLYAEGTAFLSDVAYSTLGQALRPLRPLVTALGTAQTIALDDVWSRRLVPSNRPQLLGAALSLLRRAGAERPVLVLVDDLQWADEASALALAFAARRLTGSRVRFLAGRRTGEAGVFDRAGLPERTVEPLDELAAARLLRSRYPRLAPRVSRRLLEEAGGNPLMLSELPSALDEAQRTGARPLPAVLPINQELRAIHGPRIAALPRPVRWPLLLAALETVGDLDIVAAALGEEGLEHLAPAERGGLVMIDRGVRRLAFRDPLVRSTIVDGAPRSDRDRAHRVLAAELADDAARRAWHLAEATRTPDEEIARLVERDARRSLRSGDGLGAVSGLLRAVDLSAESADRGRRLAEAACVSASVTGELGRVRPLLAEASTSELPGRASLSTAAASACLLLHGDGDIVSTQRLLARAMKAEAMESEAAKDVVDWALQVAFESCLCGGRPEAWRSLRELTTRRGRLSPDLELIVSIASDPARVSARRVEQLDEAIRGLWKETDPTRIVRVALAAQAVGRSPECRTALWRVVENGRAGNAVTPGIRAMSLLCADGFLTGRWDESAQLADEGINACHRHGYRLLACSMRLVQALIETARGDLASAAAHVAEVAEWAEPRANRALGWAVRHARALAALAADDPDGAYEHARAMGQPGALPPHNHSALAVAMDLVEAARATGRVHEAVRHAAAMRQVPLAGLSPHFSMVAIGAQAVAASPTAAADELFEEALATPDRERWAFDHARIELAYGTHLRKNRTLATARPHLDAALATFERLRAEPWAQRARHQLRAAGAQIIVPDRAPLRGTRLTPDEHEVASLAASGLTNKQIAQRLHLSPRTVSARLYRLFPKLGITARAGLRDALTGLEETRERSRS